MNDEPTDVTPDPDRDERAAAPAEGTPPAEPATGPAGDRDRADESAGAGAYDPFAENGWGAPDAESTVGAEDSDEPHPTTAYTLPIAPLGADQVPATTRSLRTKTLRRAAGVGAVIALTAAVTGVTVHAVDNSSTHRVAATASTVAAVKGTSSISTALATISPSVVVINDTITTQNNRGGFFGGGGFGGSSLSSAAGTGIVISSDGNVVTNAHVVNGATNITVTTADGKKHNASIVGLDATADLAVIKISGVSGLTPATFAQSANAAVGDSVIAVGNAEGYGGAPSVTEGIISAKNRSLSDQNESLSGLLQTDAAINPGNSGGPLVDTHGHVVGINTAVATGTSSEPAQNIGFAIPSDTVTKELPSLLAGKGASSSSSQSGSAFLGVSVGDSPTGQGALIDAVEGGSPAASAGLEAGDVVTAFGNTQINNASGLVSAVHAKQAGDTVTITVDRNGSTLRLRATLGSANAQS